MLGLYVIQREITAVLLGFRGRMLEVAEGRLNCPIPNLDLTNEIGEMSRALRTLQCAAQERAWQSRTAVVPGLWEEAAVR